MAKSSKNRIRVLLVDDNPIVRRAVSWRIKAEPDMEVVGQAEDGSKAIKLALTLQPEVVIMDVSMPRLHGVEAARQLQEHCPACRVIGFSIYTAPEAASAMSKAGAVHFVNKRDDPASLIAAIRSVCGRRAPAKQEVGKSRRPTRAKSPLISRSRRQLSAQPAL
jgi:DNA-binding NarL/FixJ family response regulator